MNKDGNISYTEFVSSIVDKKNILTEARLESVFKMFDSNKDGKLTI